MSATPVRFRPEHATVRPRATSFARAGDTHADRNELPFPTVPAIAEAIRAAVPGLNRYTVGVEELEQSLAERAGLGPGSVLVGPGSLAMLHAIVAACCAPGDGMVHAWRSFDAFPTIGRVQAARTIEIPLTAAGEHDLPAMAAAVDAETRLVIVCSPNNPNGVAVDSDGFRAFLSSIPEHVLVLLDAAYSEFTTKTTAVDGIALLRTGRHPNLAVLKTFSKAYGLAGIRLGALHGAPGLIAGIARLGLMSGVSDLAVAAGTAAIGEEALAEVGERVSRVIAERERMKAVLSGLGYAVTDSQTNFVFIPSTGHDSERFRAFASDHGVGVRSFAADGVRASVVDAAGNDRFLAVAEAWARRNAMVPA